MSNRYKQRRWMDKDIDTPFEKIKKSKNKLYTGKDNNAGRRITAERSLREFKCLNCGAYITTAREDSGVNNRNHCPHCLWSRHVDLDKPGDRKAACRSRMRPIGLTVKQTHKRYNCCQQGELMVIHQCSGCGKISINRIAADDNAYRLYDLFMLSTGLDTSVKAKLDIDGIQLLGARDLTLVHSQLFGWQALLVEFHVHNLELPIEVDVVE